MTAPRRRTATGEIKLPLTAADAFDFFTPEGERSWVPGWDPRYPGGEPSEVPGTVFVTGAGGQETLWVIVMLDRASAAAAYARVTPGLHAGTVGVGCVDVRPGWSVATVNYEMTALDDGPAAVLDGYAAAPFAAMMDEWRAGITAAI